MDRAAPFPTAWTALIVALCVAFCTAIMPARTADATPAAWSTTTSTRELDGTYATWAAQFNTAHLAGAVPNLHFDGTGASICFTVEVSNGQSLVDDPAYWQLHETSPNPAHHASAAAGGEFGVRYVLSNPTAATVTITGPLAPETTYEVRFRTIPSNPAQPYFERGLALTATTSFQHLSSTATNVDTSGKLLQGHDQAGFGGFSITNLVQGGAAEKMPAGARFIITGAYTLPEGTTTSDYPNWVAPGTVRGDATGGTFTMTVEKDSSATLEDPGRPGEPVLFPLGTTIRFKQQQPQDTAEYTWSAPVFRMHNDMITGVMLNQEQTHIEVVNKVQLKEHVSPIVEILTSIPYVGTVVGSLLASVLGILPMLVGNAGSSSASGGSEPGVGGVGAPGSSGLGSGGGNGLGSSARSDQDGPGDESIVLGRDAHAGGATPSALAGPAEENSGIQPIHVSNMLEASGASWVVIAVALLIIVVAGVVLITSVHNKR